MGAVIVMYGGETNKWKTLIKFDGKIINSWKRLEIVFLYSFLFGFAVALFSILCMKHNFLNAFSVHATFSA